MRTRANAQHLVLASLLMIALVVVALLMPSSAQAQLDGTAEAPASPIPTLRVNTVRNEYVNTQIVDDTIVVNIPGVVCRETPSDLIIGIDEPITIPSGVTGAVDEPLFPVFLCEGLNTYGIGFFLYKQGSEYVFQINVYDDADVLLNDDVLIIVGSRDAKLSLNPF